MFSVAREDVVLKTADGSSRWSWGDMEGAKVGEVGWGRMQGLRVEVVDGGDGYNQDE